jgi:hypothetical protein
LTLVEVILVLALLVILGSLVVPVMEGTLQRGSLYGAGDILRGTWAKARLAAMQSGQTYVFRFEPRGGRFQIVALNELGLPETNEMALDAPDVQQKAVDMLRLPQTRLPDGVVFASGDVATSNQLLATIPGAVEGPWSNPILFHPDGTTSDASLVLSNARQATIRVTLRGLTGVSNTTDAGTGVMP